MLVERVHPGQGKAYMYLQRTFGFEGERIYIAVRLPHDLDSRMADARDL